MHPKKSFKLRQYIASHGLAHLVTLYLFICIFLSMILSGAFQFLSDSSNSFFDYLYIFWQEIFGKEPDWNLEENSTYVWGKVISAVFSLVLPSLLLGSIVYKIFVLQKKSLTFRDKCEVYRNNGSSYLNIGFYISSALTVHNLSFDIFVRTYEASKEDGKPGQYPMNTFPIKLAENMTFPLPYNYVPSNFSVPIGLINDENAEPSRDDMIILEFCDKGFRLVKGGESTTLNFEAGDFCELFIVGNAEVPELQSHIREIKKYKIPGDVAANGLPIMRTRFIKEEETFLTENWEDF